MPGLKWRRPQGQIQLMVTIGMSAMVLVIFLIPSIRFGSVNSAMIVALAVLLLATVGGLFVSYLRWKVVWHSISTLIRKPTHLMIPKITKVLTDENVPFTEASKGPDEPVSSLKTRWDEVIGLNYGELRLNLRGIDAGTLVYLGPVKDGNEEEVGRVKGLVERIAGEA